MLLFHMNYICSVWVLNVMLSLQPKAPWLETYPETANTICQVAQDNPIYPGDVYKSASLLIAVAYHESRFSQKPPKSPSRCMIQLSPIWISSKASLYECLFTGSTLLRQSIEKYGDIRSYTHGIPYPKHDYVGLLRLKLADKIIKERQEIEQ